uniref:ATP synthase subunit f, mitochondrial n=1 Tax=Oncorhynchus mykiss TaxID=8022 RepID=A0A8C7QW42_ONCMY
MLTQPSHPPSDLTNWNNTNREDKRSQQIAVVLREVLYIDVRKDGLGGVAMLLAGYCILSYTCSYPHIKHDRWRKYH